VTATVGLLRVLEKHFGTIEECAPVSGGSIATAHRLDLSSGGCVFVKLHTDAGALTAEVHGLKRLRAVAPDEIGVPDVLGSGTLDDGTGWLALPWVEPAALDASGWAHFGAGLAGLHSAACGSSWGLDADGWIGSLPMENGPLDDWADFWRSRRLDPQLRLARAKGFEPGRTTDWRDLEAMLPERLTPAATDGPSLLHGDLWSGNVLGDRAGRGWLIDPAVYRGHREVDLAMADLFGGFPPSFWSGYEDRRPLQPGFHAERKPIYQLFYLLVHVNLFGRGYVGRTEVVLRQALASA
jgi:fructosamine-3-kinase